MCGFAGYWNYSNASADGSLAAIGSTMGKSLEHRGPDAFGIWHDDDAGIVLAHQRLAIVDLTETGSQPMMSGSGRYVLIYNGEVYNASELQQSLQLEGVTFRGSSDTEVILAACETWGVAAAVKKMIGMFAFALWDRERRQLHLVRDRIGIKPLYFGSQRGILLFASELKSFFSHPQWQPAINHQALVEYFRLGYVPTPLSIYEGIHKLKPGHIVTINQQGKITEEAYWQLSEFLSAPSNKDSNTVESQFSELLRSAVQYRMVADVPLGAFLSGGIDSTVVVLLMQQQSQHPVKSFTIGFEHNAYNEAPFAKKIAAYLGTDHHEFMVTSADALATIPQLATWYDEPFADSSQIPTYLVSKLARQFVTVSLSGDGGDELLAGYSRYKAANLFWSRLGFLPQPLRVWLSKALEVCPPHQWNQLVTCIPARWRPSNFSEKMDKLFLLLKSHKNNFYQDVMSVWSDPESLVKKTGQPFELDRQIAKLPLLEQMQYTDTMGYLPDDILTKVDRASMAVGLEARVPLLDHRVIEYAWQLPRHFKIQNGQSKWLMRRILEKYIPTALTERPKMGFAIPLEDWLRGPLRDWAEHLLSKDRLESQGILNSAPIRERWQMHLSGKRNFRHALWSVLMFQAWHDRWMTLKKESY